MRVLLFVLEVKEESKTAFFSFTKALLEQSKIQFFRFGKLITGDARFDLLPPLYEQEELKTLGINMIITAGGDGTMLKAAAFVGNAGIPLLGFNLGRMGFLAVVEKDAVRQMITTLEKGDYHIENRSTLQVISQPVIFQPGAFALNDFTILKRDNSSMIRIHTILNGEYLNTYWADGIILATPTGSTGYSLSCGGPIVFPQSGNFVLTPIAPHNLNVRPVVISDSSVLEFKVEGRSDSFLCTLDSQYGLVTPDHTITLKKNSFNIQLIQLSGHTFLKTLRDKLMWGLDMRN
ncbi:MAG: NAD kinase [Saprospiraceae bacterium]|nr:NAD kinase [Saprospiraceae bacterium]